MNEYYSVGTPYYKYIVKDVCSGDYVGYDSVYSELLAVLHDIPFRWCIMMDENRNSDGLDLMYKYAWNNSIKYDTLPDRTDEACSVLEFLIGVSRRIEFNLDNWKDDRTGKWFWLMIKNIGLINQVNGNVDLLYVKRRVDIMLNRQFGDYGERGGLLHFKQEGESMVYQEWWKHITRFCFENQFDR